MDRRSVRTAGHYVHTTHICPGIQKYTSNATFREVYDTRHAYGRVRMCTHVHTSRGRRCPTDENSTGIARRDAFSEIYAVVAGILREGNMFHGLGTGEEREFGAAYFLISLPRETDRGLRHRQS